MTVLQVTDEPDRNGRPRNARPTINEIERHRDPVHGDAGEAQITASPAANRLRVFDGTDAYRAETGAEDIREEAVPAETRAQPWSHDRSMALIAVGYWLVFWLLNGLDKFLNRTDLGLFAWYGKDRTEQFTGYFERLEVPVHFIDPVLYFAGVWELLVAAPLLAAVVLLCRQGKSAKLDRLVGLGFVLSGITFIAFSAFDVVAGDRAELREHGLYLVVLLVSYMLTRTASIGMRQSPVGLGQVGARPSAR